MVGGAIVVAPVIRSEWQLVRRQILVLLPPKVVIVFGLVWWGLLRLLHRV